MLIIIVFLLAVIWGYSLLLFPLSVHALQWPSPSPTVTTGYGWRIHPTEGVPNWHNGIDIRTNGSTKLKAVETDAIRYIVNKMQMLGTGGNIIDNLNQYGNEHIGNEHIEHIGSGLLN